MQCGKSPGPSGICVRDKNIKNIFKGVTLHLLARIIAWSPAPAEINLGSKYQSE
jgi:hypothetical protein